MALGFPLGYTEQGLRYLVGPTAWGPLYLIALSVLTEAAAMLTLGLVQPWGEVVPRWVPLIGGRAIPPLAAIVPAWLGVAGLTMLWTPIVFWWAIPHPDLDHGMIRGGQPTSGGGVGL
ncbi:hypothetical protein [Micromonospora sonchi]|uniref:hypothetical protein n=1 Tax=Micromonospora sonchi TaxID=1763543 RepID=UPI0016680078|nr:hypothetical protein [Micromonospora sonchi]